MSTSAKTKVAVTVVAFALLGFLLNPNAPLGAAVFGAPSDEGPQPTGGQVAALMAVALLESVAFGLGAAFLLFGLPLVRHLVGRPGAARAAWLAVAWSLLSWVPHTALHQTAGADFAKLVAIEYAFHVTLVLAAASIAWVFASHAPRPVPARPTPDALDA